MIKKKVRIGPRVRVLPPGRVKYGGAVRHILVVLVPRYRRFYKMIFEIVCDMHCICM